MYAFRDINQKGLIEGRLKFSNKKLEMKVDTELFGPEVANIDRQTLMGVGMVNIKARQNIQMDLSDQFDVYPKPEEQLVDFITRKKSGGRLKVCPRCEEFYDDVAA